MKIEINGKSYDFEINGTVGVMYRTQSLMEREGALEKGTPLDTGDPRHIMRVFHTVLSFCNKEVPAFEEFEMAMTGKKYLLLSEYLSKRWAELEGVSADGEKTEGDEKNA